MKKTYTKPLSEIVPVEGPIVLVKGSNEVNDYKKGNDITVGDEDANGTNLWDNDYDY